MNMLLPQLYVHHWLFLNHYILRSLSYKSPAYYLLSNTYSSIQFARFLWKSLWNILLKIKTLAYRNNFEFQGYLYEMRWILFWFLNMCVQPTVESISMKVQEKKSYINFTWQPSHKNGLQRLSGNLIPNCKSTFSGNYIHPCT
jgi:hypothetical protein